MPTGNIQEQIDAFMKKLDESGKPEKPAGETVVSKINKGKKKVPGIGVITSPKETTDEAIIAFIKELPPTGNFYELEQAVISKFPLLHPSAHLTQLIIDNCDELTYDTLGAAEDHSSFLKQLTDIVSVLDETMVGSAPELPISLYKIKGEWKAALVPQKEEPKMLEAGPPAEEEHGTIILTKPVEVKSLGNNKQSVPPTFIPVPQVSGSGEVHIKQFIWTVPIDTGPDTFCQVVLSYGAETFLMHGTFASASVAPPFQLNKGGVLKVSLLTTQPIDVWLELELEIIQPDPFVEFIKKVESAGSPVEYNAPDGTHFVPGSKFELKASEEESDINKLSTAMDEFTDAQNKLLSEYGKLDGVLQETFGDDYYSFKSAVEQVVKNNSDVMQSELNALTKKLHEKGEQSHAAPVKIVEIKAVPKGNITKSDEPNGYKPDIKNVVVDNTVFPVKQLADMLRDLFKDNSFTHYQVEGSDHEYKKTKGVLMHFKVTWAGDPEANLIKWAQDNPKLANEVFLHYHKSNVTLPYVIGQMAKTILDSGG